MKKKRLLPEAKIGLAVIAGGFIIASSMYVVRRNTPPQVAEANIVFETIAEKTNIDTDGDGLFDWEETTWKTDPELTDTDGDGTNDGEEVALGRNPLAHGPDDELPPSGTPFDPSLPDPEAEVNATELVAVTIASRYGVVKDLGTFDREAIEKIIEGLPSTYTSLVSVRPVTKSELTLVGSSIENLREYSLTLQEISERISSQNPGQNELHYLSLALQESDLSQLENINTIISGYETLIEEYTAVKVPSTVAEKHLRFVNSIKNLLQATKAMRKLDTDPLMAYAGASVYSRRAAQYLLDLHALDKLLEEKGISE